MSHFRFTHLVLRTARWKRWQTEQQINGKISAVVNNFYIHFQTKRSYSDSDFLISTYLLLNFKFKRYSRLKLAMVQQHQWMRSVPKMERWNGVTYAEHVGEDVELLSRVESRGRRDGPRVRMSEADDSQTDVTQRQWHLRQLGQTKRHRPACCNTHR